MLTETRITDAKARLVLPKSFANATVIVEHISETEIRVRRAKVVAEDDLPFAEELPRLLSDRDRDRFLELLANPPAPNAAMKKAAARHKARRQGSTIIWQLTNRPRALRLGEGLLYDAQQRSLDLAVGVGVQAMEVHAIDASAATFYRKYGFSPLLDSPLHLYLPIATIEEQLR